MLGFCLLAPMGDALAKILGQTLSIGLLVLVRFAVQAAILAPVVLLTTRRWQMTRKQTVLITLRMLLHMAGIGMMFTSLKYLPLADAVAIAFVMPFIMLLLGKTVLNETVGPRRLIACAVGFVGTLLVVQPSFQDVGWPALLPLGVAVDFALFMLLTRMVAKDIDPITLQAINGLMAVALLVPLLVLLAPLGLPLLELRAPHGTEWPLLLAIGTLGTFAHLLMTWSLRFAPSATLAPMQYLEIPFATIIGWLVFRDLPNGLAAVGITITMAAGLYIVLRERATSQQTA